MGGPGSGPQGGTRGYGRPFKGPFKTSYGQAGGGKMSVAPQHPSTISHGSTKSQHDHTKSPVDRAIGSSRAQTHSDTKKYGGVRSGSPWGSGHP